MFRRNGSTLGYWKNDMFYKRYTEVFYTRKTSFFRILLSSVSHLVISDSLWPHGCSLPGSSVHRILQERIQVWVAICVPKGSSWPRDRIQVCCIAGRFFTVWATREVCNQGHELICNVVTWSCDLCEINYGRLEISSLKNWCILRIDCLSKLCLSLI